MWAAMPPLTRAAILLALASLAAMALGASGWAGICAGLASLCLVGVDYLRLRREERRLIARLEELRRADVLSRARRR